MRRLLAPALLILLAACAVPQSRSRTFEPYAPLRAYITSVGTGRPLFQVNRPAYVAMFYIAPGRGVSMLYPGFGSGSLSGRVFAGSHFAGYRINNYVRIHATGTNLLDEERFQLYGGSVIGRRILGGVTANF